MGREINKRMALAVSYCLIVGYTGELARARDTSRPIDRRLMALDNLTGQYFNPFGHRNTLKRLRAAVGLDAGDDWTADHLLRAVDLVDHGHRSWAAFRDARLAERSHGKATHQRPNDARWQPPLHEWLAQYATGALGDIWQTQNLGDCAACGHPWLSHAGSAGCVACEAAEPFKPNQFGVDTRRPKRCGRPIPVP